MLKCKDNFWEFVGGVSVSIATEAFLLLSFHILGLCVRCQCFYSDGGIFAFEFPYFGSLWAVSEC